MKRALLFTPIFVLIGLIGVIACGAWVAGILRGSSEFADAPSVIQKLARGAYFRARTEWPTLPDCATFDKELLYKPRPGTCEFQNTEFMTTQHFDERGFRYSSLPRATLGAAPLPRLVILGDSHTMGWGVEDDETFASVLASEHGYSTVNLGVASYATPRELRRLERDMPLLMDDLIIVQYSDNDLTENRGFVVTGQVGPYEIVDFERYFQGYAPVPARTWPIAGLLLRTLWRDALNQLPDPARIRPIPLDTRPVADPATTLLEVLERFSVRRTHRLMVVAINANLTTHLSEGREQFARAGVPLVVPELCRDDFFDLDDHMRPSGHRVVAAAIAGALDTGFPSP